MGKKYSYWVNSGKYSMMQKLSVIFFGVLAFMLLARALQPQELGVWGLFLIISSIIETSRNALIRNGYILFIHTRETDEHPGIEYAALMTNITFSAIFIGLFLALAHMFEQILNAPGLATLLYYYCITLLVLIPFSYIEIFLTSRKDFKGIFWMYFIRNGIFLLSLVYFYFSKTSLSITLLAVLYCSCAFLGLLTGTMQCRRYERVQMKKENKIYIQFIGFGKYVFGNNLFSLIFRSTDSFMTASLISSAASAFYTTCGRITNFVDLPSQVLGDIMFPKAAQIMKKNDRSSIKAIYEKTVAATLTFTIPVILLVLFFPRQILYVLAGDEYLTASPILQVMVFYGFFLPFIKQFGNIMDAMGRPKVNFFLMGVFAPVNIALNLIGIHYFGLYGAAYGTLLSYFLLFLTTQIILKHVLEISVMNVFGNIISLYPDYVQMFRNSLRNIFRFSYER